jgi:hypothetical protein
LPVRVVLPTAVCKAVVFKQVGWWTSGSIPPPPNDVDVRVGEY